MGAPRRRRSGNRPQETQPLRQRLPHRTGARKGRAALDHGGASMIVVRVELHSAVTRKITELARLHICNEGGTDTLRDYGIYVARGRDKEALDRSAASRSWVH